MVITIESDFDLPITLDDFHITFNEVEAAGPTYDNMELSYETCWVTGEEFLKCVHGSYVCDASDQGTCSDSDPGEG